MTETMATGWYYLKYGASPNQQSGPLTWEELYALGSSGLLQPADLVWHPTMPQWEPAGSIPGLFPYAVQPVVQPAPQEFYAYPPPAGAPPKRSSKPLPVLIPIVTLVLVGAALGIYFGAFYNKGDDGSAGNAGGGGTSSTEAVSVELGALEITDPDVEKVIATETWGDVPADQICVMLADGTTRADAEAVADAIGGKVVGELEYIDVYQIEIEGTTEADLTAALEAAAAVDGVEAVSPNQQTAAKEQAMIVGVRVTPLNDPAYAGDYGKGMELIGAQKAWDYIRGSGLPLSGVKVGIVDTGLYKGSGEFDGEAKIDHADPKQGDRTSPEQVTPKTGSAFNDPTGGHGTGIAGQIGGNSKNGGLTGLVSPVLGNKLTMSMYNFYSGPRLGKPEFGWMLNTLNGVLKQIENKAQVVNCSFGTKAPEEKTFFALAYRKLFEKRLKEDPKQIFVVAAGNESGRITTTNYAPAGAGSGLANVITVGNVMNDGTKAASTNTAGEGGEVTIFAPGQQAVQGVDSEGKPITLGYDYGNGLKNAGGGTSYATAQVTSTVALLQSLNPGLDAAAIKKIIVESARKNDDGDRILAMDEAVFTVINQVRADQDPKLPALTKEQLENLGVIDSYALSTDTPGVWSVSALPLEVSEGGTTITVAGSDGVSIDGDTSQTLSEAGGEVTWPEVTVTYPDEKATPTITVTRTDTGGASIITFIQDDLTGHWEGTYTFTKYGMDLGDLGVPGEAGADPLGLDAINAKLENSPMPAKMDITMDKSDTGKAILTIDGAAVWQAAFQGSMWEGMPYPNAGAMTYTLIRSGAALTFKAQGTVPDMVAGGMTGTLVKGSGGALTIEGKVSVSTYGVSIEAVFTLTKK